VVALSVLSWVPFCIIRKVDSTISYKLSVYEYKFNFSIWMVWYCTTKFKCHWNHNWYLKLIWIIINYLYFLIFCFELRYILISFPLMKIKKYKVVQIWPGLICVCKQAALRSSCATLREWSHNFHPPSWSG